MVIFANKVSSGRTFQAVFARIQPSCTRNFAEPSWSGKRSTYCRRRCPRCSCCCSVLVWLAMAEYSLPSAMSVMSTLSTLFLLLLCSGLVGDGTALLIVCDVRDVHNVLDVDVVAKKIVCFKALAFPSFSNAESLCLHRYLLKLIFVYTGLWGFYVANLSVQV